MCFWFLVTRLILLFTVGLTFTYTHTPAAMQNTRLTRSIWGSVFGPKTREESLAAPDPDIPPRSL